MADLNLLGVSCVDVSRGKRGPRGHRGHRGPAGDVDDANVFQNFIFQPGGPTNGDGNVYNDFATLVGALREFQGYKTIQPDDSFVSPVVIPPNPDGGDWDLGSFQTELMAHPFRGLAPGNVPTRVTFADGTTFKNLVQIGGYMLLTNLNTGKAPITISPAGLAPNTSQLITIGSGPQNNYPQILNNGTQPLIDLTAVGTSLLIRIQGTITGSHPAIDMGVNAGPLLLSLYDSARITANMIVGTNPAAHVFRFDFGNSQTFGQQPNFAGTINNGSPVLNFNQGSAPVTRDWIVPANANSAPIVPLTAATVIGCGSLVIYNTTGGPIVQSLPKIKNPAPATGGQGQADGTNDVRGQTIKIKNAIGANTISVSPAAGDTIDYGGGPTVITAGRCFNFEADGINNWNITAAF
jgi:hypothetical protein